MPTYTEQKFRKFKESYFRLLTRKIWKIKVITTEYFNVTYILLSQQNISL